MKILVVGRPVMAAVTAARTFVSHGDTSEMIDAFEQKISSVEDKVDSSTNISASTVKHKKNSKVMRPTTIKAATESDLEFRYLESFMAELDEKIHDQGWAAKTSWEMASRDLILTLSVNEAVYEFQIPYTDLSYSDIAADTDHAFNEIKSAVSEVVGATKIVEMFRDSNGVFGLPGDIVSKGDFKQYWEENYDYDPSLQEYNSFEDWWADTKDYLTPVDSYTDIAFPDVTGCTSVTSSTYDDEPQFVEIASKEVADSDGFLTEYTMYRDVETGEYVFVFGDKDLYSPEDGDFDWSADSEQEAWEWFNSYGEPDEDDFDDEMSEEELEELRNSDLFSATEVEADEDSSILDMLDECSGSIIDAGYTEDGEIIVTFNNNVSNVDDTVAELTSIFEKNGITVMDWNTNGSNVFIFTLDHSIEGACGAKKNK